MGVSHDRVRTALASRFRQYSRDYLFLGLLVYLPVTYVGLMSQATPPVDIPVRTSYGLLTVELMRPMGQVNGVVMTAAAAVFITSMVGLFTMYRSRDGDVRLLRAGFDVRDLVIARVGLLIAVATAGAGIGIGVLLLSFTPNYPGQLLAAVVALAVTYGLVGLAVGRVLDRLAGLYVMLFVPMLDVAVFQNPTFLRGEPPTWILLLPAYNGMKMVVDAAFGDGIALLNAELALVVLGVAGLFAWIAVRQTGVVQA